MELGAILKNIRREKGMSQKQMAKFLNVSDVCICNWENGKSTPNHFGIEVLKEKLGIDCSHLSRGKNNFYHLKARLKQYPNEPMLPIYKTRYMDKLLDELKWASATKNINDEMLCIGLISIRFMQHCFKHDYEFEACLATAMEYLENRGGEEKRWIELNNSRNRFKN